MNCSLSDDSLFRRDATRGWRAVLVADMVESVRLIDADEEGTIGRWRRFVDIVVREELPALGGRLVKSLGDGLLVVFPEPVDAVRGAFAMRARLEEINADAGERGRIVLRIGIHADELIIDGLDVYGKGVNLAARLASLAAPGQVVVSSVVGDRLVRGLDADVEDLGDCRVKHLDAPVHAFRVLPAATVAAMPPARPTSDDFRPALAVMPFSVHGVEADRAFLGDALADEIIASLSRGAELRVLSRLSSAALRGRALEPGQLRALLGVDWLLDGSLQVSGEQARVIAQLVDARSGEVVWSARRTGRVPDLFMLQQDWTDEIARGLNAALRTTVIRRGRQLAWHELDGYGLMLRAVEAMHRTDRAEFDLSRQMLHHAVARWPGLAAPRAWLAKWFVMRVAQGWSVDTHADAREASAQLARALDIDPSNALALAIDGMVNGYVSADLVTAAERYEAALDSNPNESLAWLFKSALGAWTGRGEDAILCADRALSLSPLDPLRYYYDSLAGTAYLSAGRFDEAIALSSKSLRANRRHTSSWRTLAVAQVLSGRLDEARLTVAALRELEPRLTVGAFMSRYPGRASAHAPRYGEALRQAGLPD